MFSYLEFVTYLLDASCKFFLQLPVEFMSLKSTGSKLKVFLTSTLISVLSYQSDLPFSFFRLFDLFRNQQRDTSFEDEHILLKLPELQGAGQQEATLLLEHTY